MLHSYGMMMFYMADKGLLYFSFTGQRIYNNEITDV